METDLAQWLEDACSRLKYLSAGAPQLLTAEASHRRFWRQPTDSGSVVLMASPPTLERNDAFETLARVFAAAGLPVPRILDQDRERGFFLLTDVGQRDLKDCYDAGQADAALSAALHWLARLQPVRNAAIVPYSGERLHMEIDLFNEWLAQRALGTALPATLRRSLAGLLVHSALEQPRVCVHRDYHCRNLLFDGAARFGIVDFQDALEGPLCYDLASLLHDCYHRFEAAEIHHWREQFRQAVAPSIRPARFARMTELLAIQRQLKAIGIFARLKLRDNKETHVKHIAPTVSALLELTAGYRETNALCRWLQDHERAIKHWAGAAP